MAADGNPWVWVMGEHKDDLSYEELVRKKYVRYSGTLSPSNIDVFKVRKREEEELEKEKLSELELRKEAEQLAKNETLQIMLLASE